MKKPDLKKLLKRRLKKWNVGDYVRQFSIVTGGVLLTLWLSSLVTTASKQREVRQAMQLVALELRANAEIIRDYEWLYNEERRIARELLRRDFSVAGLPADTVALYWQRTINGMGKPYRFQTDALEMFKTTGVAVEIADKRIVIDLLRSYKNLEIFDYTMGLYYEQRSKTLVPLQMSDNPSDSERDLAIRFAEILSVKTMQGWIGTVPRAFDAHYFDRSARKIEEMISQLEQRYR